MRSSYSKEIPESQGKRSKSSIKERKCLSSMFKSKPLLFNITVLMASLAVVYWFVIGTFLAADGDDVVDQFVNIDQLLKVSLMSDGKNFDEFKKILNPFLRTRVSGSEGNDAVRNYISSFLTSMGWNVEHDSFQDNTPMGVKPFTNIMATSNPHAKRHLVLACHHDSKYFEEFDFIGACDSAVPCAIMLAIAKQLDGFINKDDRSADLALKLIFFDGEEAFKTWTRTDSLYGSRHLAARMAGERVQTADGSTVSKLDQIDLFVLLDLIGTKDASFLRFASLDHKYERLASAEKRLKQRNLLNYSSNPARRRNGYFNNMLSYGAIQDDHIPFMERGVKILHLISSPFPSVWHTVRDNESNLDYPSINNIMKCLRLFVIEHLRINIP